MMPVSLKHNFQSAKGDTPDATLIQPSYWNAEHVLTCNANSVLGRAATAGPIQEITANATGRAVMAAATTADGRTALEAASAADMAGLLGRNLTAGIGLLGGGTLAEDRSFAADIANAAQWRAAAQSKLLDAKTVWDSMSEVVLTDGATINWDMGSGFDFVVTLAGSRTIAAPTNVKVGQKGRLIIIQDAGGSRTIAWNAAYKFANGVKPTLSTAANAVDVLYYDVRSSSYIIMSLAGRAFA
jgi:hypothetical protein